MSVEEGPDIGLSIEITEAAIELQGSLNQTTWTISIPNDGVNRREEVEFLVSILPQVTTAAFDALEAE